MRLEKMVKYFLHSTSQMKDKVVSKTGKNPIFVFCDMGWCALRYGASPKNYYWFGFYDLPPKMRKTYVTHRLSERIQKKRNAPNKVFIFCNKSIFNQTFHRFVKRASLETKDLTSANDLLALGEKIIYKPLASSMGKGIQVFQITDETVEQVYQTLVGLPSGLVETFLKQHKDMEKFSDSAVNILRIVTGRVGDQFSVLAATAAFSKGLPYTNATGDAVFANVDINSGTIMSDGCDYDENVFDRHPVSGTLFKGFVIPFWDEAIAMLKAASGVVPEIGYVGWDVAITPDGPAIIEGNNDPGYEWMQLRMINLSGIGKKKEYSFLL